MTRLAILGAGGHAKVVADAALLQGCASVVFFDDRWPQLDVIGPWCVNGALAALLTYSPSVDAAVVAIGDNEIRLTKQRSLMEAGLSLFTVIHPRAVISPLAEIGEGTVIFAGAVVNAFARLGLGCIVNTGATVDHDCELGDGVHVSPGSHLGGGVRIGRGSSVGIGASVKPGVSIGAAVFVGAGAAVVGDVADGLTVVGVPARPIVRSQSFPSS